MASVDHYVLPRRIFRFRSLGNFEREVRAIEEGRLHCSSFDNLNDPMEGLFRSSRQLRKTAEYLDIRREILQNKSKIRMCSFTEVHNHELMWAHYANQFKGICIAYDFAKFLNSLPKFVSFTRMSYDENVPRIPTRKTDPSILAKMVLSTKNYRWLYEREWRMFSPESDIQYENNQCVVRVYLGSRISEDHREEILLRLRRIKIPVSQMAINQYSISFTQGRRSKGTGQFIGN